MAIDQATQDIIDATAKAVAEASAEANAKAISAANGRGEAPSQTVWAKKPDKDGNFTPLTDAKGDPIWELDDAGQPVLDANGDKVQAYEMWLVNVVTGKPPRNSMQVYEDQRKADLAKRANDTQPDYDNDPVWGTQKGQTADPELSAQAKAHRSQAAPTPPADPYKSTSTLLPDPVSGQIPPIPPRDPWSAKWTITGPSGLVAESTDSATIAANIWNSLVTSYQKP